MRKFTSSTRNIGPKSSSLSGKFISKKQDSRIIQFESSLERDFLYLAEFNNDIVSFIDQPVKIIFLDSKRKKRVYTPDFFVEYRNSQKSSEIIEIKYSKDLHDNFNIYEEKFYHAQLYCQKNMLTFSVLTEKDIRDGNEEYLKNINFLFKYKDKLRRKETIFNQDKNIKICLNLIQELRIIKVCTINELINRYDLKYSQKNDIASYIWFLISNNYINSNLKESLTKNSLIWVQ